MRIIDSKKEYLVDLKWPELLPKNLLHPVQNLVVAETESGLDHEPTFQLTSWRGAGWRMVFSEEPAH